MNGMKCVLSYRRGWKGLILVAGMGGGAWHIVMLRGRAETKTVDWKER